MAKTVGPLMSLDAHGTVAGNLTFSKRKTCKQVRFQKKQTDVITTDRTTVREKFAEAVAAWNILSDNDKATWNINARPYRITGYNLYIKEYMLTPPVPIEIDYMEYANDGAAQAAYVTDADAGNNANTKLLLPYTGTNGSQVIPDTSVGGAHGNATAVAHAQLSTAEYKFSPSSLLLDGVDDYIWWPDSDDWALGYVFTIAKWIRFNTDPSAVGMGFIAQVVDANNRWALFTAGNEVAFHIRDTGNYLLAFWVGKDFAVDTWYHIEFVRIDGGNSSTSWRIFINGISQTLTKSQGAWNTPMPTIAGPLEIGKHDGANFFDGHMDEINVTKGKALHTANFTPPTSPYSTTPDLQCYSENTIKTQGNYSLKTIAL